MIRTKLPQCRQCGSYIIMAREETQLLETLGAKKKPSMCSYCRRQAMEKHFEDARTDPAKREEYQCSICQRTFILLPVYRLPNSIRPICPDCVPRGIHIYPEAIIRLNRDLGYPR